MDPGGISVERVLPVDAALIGEVLLRLRRDARDGWVKWTLGDRGSVEVDANFTSRTDAWVSAGRIWDHNAVAVASVGVQLRATSDDELLLTLRPTDPVPTWWAGHLPELLDLAHAVVDELGEELLWHAARAGIGARG